MSALKTAAERIAEMIYEVMAIASPFKFLALRKIKKISPLRINAGSGKTKYPGWVSIDMRPGADLMINIKMGLPFDSGSVDAVYSEHLIEHFTRDAGKKILKEFRRCLKKGGVLRMATPDLDYIVQKYGSDWRGQAWLADPRYECVRTKGEMINACFGWWGHKYLYNEEDLREALAEAGFLGITRCEVGKSDRQDFRGLETREDSKLVMEAETA